MNDWRDRIRRATAQFRGGRTVGRLHRWGSPRAGDPVPQPPGRTRTMGGHVHFVPAGEPVPNIFRPAPPQRRYEDELVPFVPGMPGPVNALQKSIELENAPDRLSQFQVQTQNLVGLGLMPAMAPFTDVLVVNNANGKQAHVKSGMEFSLQRLDLPGRQVSLSFIVLAGRAVLSYTAGALTNA